MSLCSKMKNLGQTVCIALQIHTFAMTWKKDCPVPRAYSFYLHTY